MAICRLIAPWVTFRYSAAALKLPVRAAASKPRSVSSGRIGSQAVIHAHSRASIYSFVNQLAEALISVTISIARDQHHDHGHHPTERFIRADPVATVAIIVTIFAWASAFPAIRAGLAAFGPLELGAIRFAIAAVPAAIFLP